MKKKKTVIIIAVVIVGIIISTILGLFITKTTLTNAALNYLCEKYSASEEEFELVESENGSFYVDRTVFFNIRWSSFKWKYKYNNIVFNVERINSNYYDDYQLNDLFYWTTEYFKKNINEDIVGISISSDMIYFHNNKYDAYENTQISGFVQNQLWTENEILSFWNSQIVDDLYVYVKSMDNKEQIAEDVSKILSKSNCIIICPTNTLVPNRTNNDSNGVVLDLIEMEECGETFVYWPK